MMWAADQAVTDRDSVLMTTPMFHAQCWGLPQVAVQARSQVVLPGRYSAEQIHILADAMVRFEVTVTNGAPAIFTPMRSEEHTSELQSLMRIAYAVFCLKQKH